MYLLINHSAGYLGNSPMFWRKNGCGYTQWIDDAELFTEEDAEKTIRGCRGSHNLEKVSQSLVNSLAKRTIDMQDLRRVESEKNE